MAGRFTSTDGTASARVVIEQRADSGFVLREGFRYRDEGADLDLTVLPADLPVTDLASVPWFLRWFVPAYGRHSLAALLHDHLIENGARLVPPVSRVRADEIFLAALGDLRVPLVRRHLMWAAVNLKTRLNRGGLARFGMQAWIVASLLGTATLLGAIVAREPLLTIGAVIAPIAGALMWWPQFRIGLVAGYGAALLGPPAITISIAYATYALTERAVGRGRWLVSPFLFSRRPAGASPPGNLATTKQKGRD
ncbi:MAG: DUF1353 domain-containing protein [Candidatus Binatia bacterium]|nr:DUF1353 domain-containing protein [Candidatus Binatia bacterium]